MTPPLTPVHPNLGHTNDHTMNPTLTLTYIALPPAAAGAYPTPFVRSEGPSPSSLRRRCSPRSVTTSTTDSDVHSRDPALPSDASLLSSAILDLTNVIKSNHEENKQVIYKLRKEMSTLLITVSNGVQLLSAGVYLPENKKKKTNSDLDASMMNAHDWIKV